MKDLDAAVEALQRRYMAAVSARNADALVQLYEPKARVFDAWGIWEYNGADSWRIALEGWLSSQPDERLQVRFDQCSVLGSSELVTMTAIVTYAQIAADGTESRSMQNRITWIARTAGYNLRIVHEHTSAPIGFEDMKAILKKPS